MGARLFDSLAPLFSRFRAWFDTWMVLVGVGFGFNSALTIVLGAKGNLIPAIILATISGTFLIALLWQLRERRFLREWMLSFDARREAIEAELQLIELEAREGHSPAVLAGHLDFCIDQVLCLATAITDRPTDALSANYMDFDKATRRLRITQIFGVYSRLRVRQERDVDDPARRGSCGIALVEKRILLIPRVSAFPGWEPSSPDERHSLAGLINIPIPARVDQLQGEYVGVLNIDSPRPGTLDRGQDRVLRRATQIQAVMARAQSLRRSLVPPPAELVDPLVAETSGSSGAGP